MNWRVLFHGRGKRLWWTSGQRAGGSTGSEETPRPRGEPRRGATESSRAPVHCRVVGRFLLCRLTGPSTTWRPKPAERFLEYEDHARLLVARDRCKTCVALIDPERPRSRGGDALSGRDTTAIEALCRVLPAFLGAPPLTPRDVLRAAIGIGRTALHAAYDPRMSDHRRRAALEQIETYRQAISARIQGGSAPLAAARPPAVSPPSSSCPPAPESSASATAPSAPPAPSSSSVG
jgi:hypothetical protein